MGLATLAVTAIVAIGGGGVTLVHQSRGEIGIALAAGTPPARVVSHYLAVAGVITLVGVVIGCGLCLSAGGLVNGWLEDAGRRIGVPLAFHLDEAIVVWLAALMLVVAEASVLLPAVGVTRILPAQLLRVRDR
jgi:ABC-type antimicrobial peptide transport system permease subunit